MAMLVIVVWLLLSYLVFRMFSDTHQEEMKNPAVYFSVVLGVVFMLPLFIIILIIENL